MSQNMHLEISRLCDSIMDLNNGIQSVAVINKNGRAVEKKSRDKTTVQIAEEKCASLFLQSALEIAMKKDYDDDFGPITYNLSERENQSVFSFPLYDSVILVTSNKDNSPISLAGKIVDVINRCRNMIDATT